MIPAHPLALTAERKLDERRQRALTRYYMSAGAGGVAVAVHTTQFAIRDPKVALLRPVLTLAAEETEGHSIVKIAGICGDRRQAVGEAEFAKSLRYDAGLLRLPTSGASSIAELVDHARAVAEILPVIGFYLQPAVGGQLLPYEFWRAFVEIPQVVAIKIAPFNRYQTLDVVRAVVDSGRTDSIALYTGNDDNVIADLLTEFDFGGKRIRIIGGLLGHWAVWTRGAVSLVRRAKEFSAEVPSDLLTIAQQVTDMNAAIFDARNGFRGCIAGIHEVLRRQQLMAGRWCLDEGEDLSPGQVEEIDRVCRAYPHLVQADDQLIQQHLDEWLR